MTSIIGMNKTYNSQFLDKDVIANAMLVEANMTRTLDLFQELPMGRNNPEWYDYVKKPRTGAVGVGGWDNNDLVDLPVTDAFADVIGVGQVLEVETEQVIVSAVDRAANTIDVYARGHGGTTAAAHLAGVVIYNIGKATREGTVEVEAIVEESVKKVNFYQLFQELIDTSKTAKLAGYYDLGGKEGSLEQKLEWLRQGAMVDMLKNMNQTALFGLPYVGTAASPSTVGGLRHYLSQSDVVNNSVGAPFTEDDLKETLLAIQDRGGTANVILTNGATKAKINNFNRVVTDGLQTRTNRQDRGAGMIVDTYEGDGIGTLQIVTDPLIYKNEIYILNTNKMYKKFYEDDQLKYVPEPSMSNSRRTVENLQCQMTLAFKDTASDFARIHSYTL